jgi:hypothetical protein
MAIISNICCLRRAAYLLSAFCCSLRAGYTAVAGGFLVRWAPALPARGVVIACHLKKRDGYLFRADDDADAGPA